MLYRRSDRIRQHRLTDTAGQPAEPYRSDFRKDYARVIHSAAFRRLVGKTQLFPGIESDFFRNRLTHSLEVAQIAKSIANKLNYEEPVFKKNPIDTDLVETAALCHDLGHPPFGHNGEAALDECMMQYGGFEGNAQTLRILARIEKKATGDSEGIGISTAGEDLRCGLNLSSRTLASILKYDKQIPARRNKQSYDGPRKGYYASEADLVARIKANVLGPRKKAFVFKTVECHIMDLADDIAYSTYDLEDAFKAGFLAPLDLVAAKNALLEKVAQEINKRTDLSTDVDRVRAILIQVFYTLFEGNQPAALLQGKGPVPTFEFIEQFSKCVQSSRDLAQVGQFRTQFTSELVGTFIRGVRFSQNRECLPVSRVYLDSTVREIVEVLKRFTYVALIMSPRLKLAEKRGKEIVRTIFNELTSKDGLGLLPIDFRTWSERSASKAGKMRVVCDFVAGMTDRYAVEYYSRLKSESPQSIFKPI